LWTRPRRWAASLLYTVQESENYTPEWLENKRLTTDELVFAREFLMDRTASAAGRVYAQFSRMRHVGNYPYDPDKPLAIFWDYGSADETYMGFLQKDFETKELFIVGEVCEPRQDIEWFLNYYPGVTMIPNPYVVPDKYVELSEKVVRMRRPQIDFGDPSGGNMTQLRQGSLFKVLKGYGIKPRCNRPRWQNMKDRNQTVRAALDRLHVDESCEVFIRSMEAYRYPKKDPYADSTSTLEKPAHNWASHACTALEAALITEDWWKDDSMPKDMVVHSGTAIRVRKAG
jgi:hypothetical protein